MKKRTMDSLNMQTYAAIAPWFSNAYGNPDFWQDEFNYFSKKLSSGRVIDIGCGTCRDAKLFKDSGYDYVGIDMSLAMLREGKRNHPSIELHCMQMDNLGFSDSSFDGFWASASLLHIPKSLVGIQLNEIGRVTKPGGIGFISLKEGVGEKLVLHVETNTERFFAFYQAEEFSRILEQHKFKVENMYRKPFENTVWLVYFVQAS